MNSKAAIDRKNTQLRTLIYELDTVSNSSKVYKKGFNRGFVHFPVESIPLEINSVEKELKKSQN